MSSFLLWLNKSCDKLFYRHIRIDIGGGKQDDRKAYQVGRGIS